MTVFARKTVIVPSSKRHQNIAGNILCTQDKRLTFGHKKAPRREPLALLFCLISMF